ncbi:hypothetical protein ND748_15305 [Frankia sp. AiPs1]|uniref:hypothetical protein n=1 Tax=Frankia sp. AiPs1 TaxID=573493 RepID=UPI002044C6B3|nr:hypothetical protein [Frankia sp. AiPs1]MCM3923023.1 hypothetical protein [Frankia sp. AiPs1]
MTRLLNGRLLLLLLLPLLALVACSGSGDDAGGNPVAAASAAPGSAASPTGDPMLSYAQCMRDNGVQVPDPQPSNPASLYQGVDTSSVAFQTADKACAGILAGVVQERGKQDPDQLAAKNDELLALAGCLRSNGITVPDPVPGQAGGPFGKNLDRNDPAVSKALQACQPGTTGKE